MLWYRFLQYISIPINYNTNNLRKRTNNVKDKGVCNLFCRRLFGEESPGQQICPSIKKGGNTMGTRITEHPILGVPAEGKISKFHI